MNSELGRKFASVAFIVGLFLLWEFLCLAFHVSDVILPRPSQVFVTLWQRAPALWPHTLQSSKPRSKRWPTVIIRASFRTRWITWFCFSRRSHYSAPRWRATTN